MHDPSYYREQAERARRLAKVPTDYEVQETLTQIARDYDDIVEDLEKTAAEVTDQLANSICHAGVTISPAVPLTTTAAALAGLTRKPVHARKEIPLSGSGQPHSGHQGACADARGDPGGVSTITFNR